MKLSDPDTVDSLVHVYGHPDHGKMARRAEAARQRRVSARAAVLVAKGMSELRAYELAYREAEGDGS